MIQILGCLLLLGGFLGLGQHLEDSKIPPDGLSDTCLVHHDSGACHALFKKY